LSERFETHEHDVLVIGAGGAGLRAAIEALAQGVSVGVVSKSLLGKAHTVMAEAGLPRPWAMWIPRTDGNRTFATPCARKDAEQLAHGAAARAGSAGACEGTGAMGAIFDRTTDGNILQRAFGGHTYKRLCHVGDRTGLEMIRTLQDRGVQQGFDVYMECTIVRLLTDGERCVGAIGYWREQGRFVVFKAKSVVMATGDRQGVADYVEFLEYTATEWRWGYEAGAELMDLEFVQISSDGNGVAAGRTRTFGYGSRPWRGRDPAQQIGRALYGEYDPKRMELSTRDVVARSIYTEVKEGRGTEHGGASWIFHTSRPNM